MNLADSAASLWKRVIFSDECTVKFGHNFRVCEWKKNGEGAHRPDIYGVTPVTSTTRFSINTLRSIIYYGQGYLKVLEGRINTKKYLGVLDECL